MSSTQHFDSREFEILFQQWNRKVYNYAFSKTKSTYIAEETVQRVFIKLWQNITQKNIASSIDAQIFTITRSILLDIVKEEYRRKHAMESLPQATYAPNSLAQLEWKETEGKVEQLIDQLPPMRKLVFKLSRFEHLNYKEIAARLNISPRTVENHIALALKTIRKSFSNFLALIIFLKLL